MRGRQKRITALLLCAFLITGNLLGMGHASADTESSLSVERSSQVNSEAEKESLETSVGDTLQKEQSTEGVSERFTEETEKLPETESEQSSELNSERQTSDLEQPSESDTKENENDSSNELSEQVSDKKEMETKSQKSKSEKVSKAADDVQVIDVQGRNEAAMSAAMADALGNMKAWSGSVSDDGPLIEVKKEWVAYLRNKWCDLVGLKAAETGSDGTATVNGIAVFQWSATSGLTKWDGTSHLDTTDSSKYDSATSTYHVSEAFELYYALKQAVTTSGITIILEKDMDLNGQEYSWDGSALEVKDLILDGNGKTIYNLGSQNPAFISALSRSTVKNLTFANANIVVSRMANTGIFGGTAKDTTGANRCNFNKIVIKDSLIFNGYDTNRKASMMYMAPFGHDFDMNAKDCYTMDNKIFGAAGMHVGGAFARTDRATITSSFSVDSQVFSVGQHSGGFISCTDGDYGNGSSDLKNGLEVRECFTNNTVYGNKQTGVFIGGIYLTAPVVFEKCYASGSVEGTDRLGGFMGEINCWDYTGTRALTVKECYSTSIVGMQNGGTNLGGFVGKIYGDEPAVCAFTDCYVAGEVGGIDTDVSQNRDVTGSGAYATVGGFLGANLAEKATVSYEKCYYDKQTTAMREWETGKTRDRAPNLVAADLGDENGTNDIPGIMGVLTSDSKKSGSGLASQPNSSNRYGFIGFSSNPDVEVGGVSMPLWIFDGRTSDSADTGHNCMYPQLSSFSLGTETEWGEYADLVKVFSYASVSTVHENTWENCINPKHSSLSSLVYDTVRDLTSAFTMTTYADVAPKDIKINWNKSGAKTSLYGQTLDVIGEFSKMYNATWNRDYNRADKFAPGIEWLTVTYEINGVVGTRRLRIIPTSNISSGVDALNLKSGDTYNHALDMYMAYSTGQRMANSERTEPDGSIYFEDMTQGTYPTADLTSAGIFKNNYFNKNGVYEASSGNQGLGDAEASKDTISYSDPDNAANSKLVSTSYMDGGNGTLHNPNNYLMVRLYEIKVKVPETNNGEDIPVDIASSDQIPLAKSDGSLTEWGEKLSGKKAFSNEDVGRYFVEYTWVLPDARYIKDTKMILVKEKEHTVTINVVNSDGTPNAESLKLVVDTLNKGTDVAPVFKSDAEATATKEGILNETNAYIACQRAIADDESIVKHMKVEYNSGGIEQTVEIENPNDNFLNGTPIEMTFDYFYDSYESNGTYYVKQAHATRKYYVKSDSVNHFFYIALDNEFTLTDQNGVPVKDSTGQVITRNDVDGDMIFTLTMDSPNYQQLGTLIVTKQILDSAGSVVSTLTDLQKREQFIIKIDGVTDTSFDTSMVLYADKKDASDHTKTIQLKPGTYKLMEVMSMNYKLKDILATSPGAASASSILNNWEIKIEAGKATAVTVQNKTTTASDGKGGVTNELKHK